MGKANQIKQHSLDQYMQQLLYNTCNYCIYTVLRGSALFKGSKLCYLRNLTQVLVFSDKTTQMFSKQTKTEKQHKFINFYWSFLAFIDNIAQMAKIFVQLHGPRKELTINHSEIKRNPSVTHQYCFIQHIQREIKTQIKANIEPLRHLTWIEGIWDYNTDIVPTHVHVF